VRVVNEEGGYELLCNNHNNNNPTFEYHSKCGTLNWISAIQKLKKKYYKQGVLLPSKNNILVYVSDDECTYLL
jgi:hypothetical protein